MIVGIVNTELVNQSKLLCRPIYIYYLNNKANSLTKYKQAKEFKDWHIVCSQYFVPNLLYIKIYLVDKVGYGKCYVKVELAVFGHDI